MKYQFRPYAKMQPTIVTLTGKVYEKGEHPLYTEYKIIEVVDEEGEIHYAFEDELKSDEVKKQETLEEAAERLAKHFNIDFIAGAKWQQERSYSEEDVKNAFLDGWQLRDGDLPFPKAKNKWFNEFKNK